MRMKSTRLPTKSSLDCANDWQICGGKDRVPQTPEGTGFSLKQVASHTHWREQGTVVYHVKWQGYDDPKDMTWEGEDNL